MPSKKSVYQRIREVFVAPRNEAINSSRQLYEYLLGSGAMTDAGVLINSDTAMRISSVYACVRVLSEDIAKLPLQVFQRTEKGRERIREGWLVDLLEYPNPLQTGFEFREMMQSYVELVGNFYAIKTVVRGETRELIPVVPARVQVDFDRRSQRVRYQVYWPDGATVEVPQERMLHVRGQSLDGVMGLSPVAYQREAFGTSLQLTEYGSRLFKYGAMIGGVLEHPKELGEEAAKRLKEDFDAKYSGAGNAHKTILLEEGMKYSKTSMSALDAQYLDSRKFARTDIASIFRVPPHMIGDLERASFSNIEQQALEYIQNALMARLTRLEKRLAWSLIKPSEQSSHYLEHNVRALLRGDYATRMRGYQTAVLTGWMSRNEVRELENQNPGPDELNEFLQPVNMQTAEQVNAAEDARKKLEEEDDAETPPPGQQKKQPAAPNMPSITEEN